MTLVEQLYDQVAVIASGHAIASGSLEQVRGGMTLEERFIQLVGARHKGDEGLSWLTF